MAKNNKSIIYLSLSLLTMVIGYIYLRYAYKVTDTMPFTQEIVLIVLGTLSTIFITSLLLNKQTEVELDKEQNIRYLELKTTTYIQLLDLLEEMAILETFSQKELIRLQFITHKLAIIASDEVIDEYQSFLEVVKTLTGDKSFLGDMEQLNRSIGKLTLKIRKDIMGDIEHINYTENEVNEMIKENSEVSF